MTSVAIMNNNQMIRITNPNKLLGLHLPPGSFARIHSSAKNVYTVWVLDERTSSTIILEVPLVLMGQYFRQQPHNIFLHLAR